MISPILFITFSDTCIYWIHRALHHKMLYKPLHKLHHRYKETTPFSAYAFHPIDGWLQGCPYHIFVFLFPMHHVSYFISLAQGWMWTINITIAWNLPFGTERRIIRCTTRDLIIITVSIWCFGTSSVGVIRIRLSRRRITERRWIKRRDPKRVKIRVS